LPFAYDLRLERAVAVAWYRHFDRPDIGEHRLGPGTVAGVTAITARRVVLGVAQMPVHLTLGRSLDDDLRQLAQQPVLAGQLQPLRTDPIHQRTHQLLIEITQLHHRFRVRRLSGLLVDQNFSHSVLLS
jgi:hypothetical protein